MIGPRKVDKPLVVYGNGKLSALAREVFYKLNIPLVGIVDKSCAFPQNHPRDAMLVICVTTEPYQKIIEPLIAAGWKDIVSVYDVFEAYPECGIMSGWQIGEMTKEENENEMKVSSSLSDLLSRRHYNAFIGWHENRTEIDIPVSPNDRWAIPEVTSVLHDHEVIYKSHDGSNLEDIETRRNCRAWLKGWHPPGYVFTYIQLHLEGKELEAAQTSIPYFQKHRPIIAVTVYHTRDGLWKIEKELMDGLEKSRFYFRCHAFQGQAAIMYCVPEERGGE